MTSTVLPVESSYRFANTIIYAVSQLCWVSQEEPSYNEQVNQVHDCHPSVAVVFHAVSVFIYGHEWQLFLVYIVYATQ